MHKNLALVVGKQHIRAVGAAIRTNTSAAVTRATAATTEVAPGLRNVIWRAGAKGIAATRGRLHLHAAPGPLLYLTQGACHCF